MCTTSAKQQGFWWEGNSSEQYWLEQLKTPEFGDRLFAPDEAKYRAMYGVRVNDLVLHWYSERHPDARPGRSGVYAVSRVIGKVRPSTDSWEGSPSIEMALTQKTLLRRPILLTDLKQRQAELETNLERLKERIDPLAPHSMWQFPNTGLKPVVQYLSKLTEEDLELIFSDHPHLATALLRA